MNQQTGQTDAYNSQLPQPTHPYSTVPAVQTPPPMYQPSSNQYAMNPQTALNSEISKHQPQMQSQFQTATPLSALNRAPAPVDCPACGHRALTKCDHESGGFTQ